MDFLLCMFIFLFIVLLILLYPFIEVARYKGICGPRKVGWMVAVLCFSWFAYFPFLIIEECWFTK
jgi:hypothetical protein